MAKINFGGVEENVVTREEFPLEKALETLKDETIAVIGYGVQGPGQSLNLRDNGFRVIVGQREGSASWDKAVADGWVPGQTLFGIEEAAERIKTATHRYAKRQRTWFRKDKRIQWIDVRDRDVESLTDETIERTSSSNG